MSQRGNLKKEFPLDGSYFNNGSPTYSGKEIGTFKDSLRAPIHRWFKYPAGYSYKFVETSFEIFNIRKGDWVYDPFSGSGTTLVSCKQQGINGIGVEAHSFIHWVADVKLFWEFDFLSILTEINQILERCNDYIQNNSGFEGYNSYPELVYKCYHKDDLHYLSLIKEFINNEVSDRHFQNLCKLALTSSLRDSAAAGTGWPYIAPNKNTGDKPAKGAFRIFSKTLKYMANDLLTVKNNNNDCIIENILGDSREKQNYSTGQIKLALTSPPYLNNYDYGDRTRLETYFWGIAKNWSDISRDFRDKLITAATTQITRGKYKSIESTLDNEIEEITPDIYKVLQTNIKTLSGLRLKKGGKKSYDLLVALYFNDILKVLKETYRLLQKEGHFCLVLGDSAPYGVYIPTHEIIGELGLGIGFSKFSYHKLRNRGKKWPGNPQRHKVPLKEGIVILHK